MMRVGQVSSALIACIMMLTLAGCEPQRADQRAEVPVSVLQHLPVVTPAGSTLSLWEQQQQQIDHALAQAERLHQSIAELLHTPTPEQLITTRTTWLQAVEAFEPLTTIAHLARKQPHPTWHALANQFSRIASWPSRLGYLDDNGIHGATGLIFDLDTPISAEEIRHQHQLTGDYDLTTGLYPIGQVLMGYGASRDAEVFAVVAALNDALRVKGFEHVQEVPSNRRRQLIELQSTLLLEDIRLLSNLWQARQSNSPLNAFSQLPLEAQNEHLYNAAIDVVAGQLSELHEQADLPVWQATQEAPHSQALREARWQAQLTGASQWLTTLGRDATALGALQDTLKSHHELNISEDNSNLNTDEPDTTTKESANQQEGLTPAPAASSASSRDNTNITQLSLEASFAEAILALKPKLGTEAATVDAATGDPLSSSATTQDHPQPQ